MTDLLLLAKQFAENEMLATKMTPGRTLLRYVANVLCSDNVQSRNNSMRQT